MQRCPGKNGPEFWGLRDEGAESAAANRHSRRQDAPFCRKGRGSAFLEARLPETDTVRPT